MLTGDATAAADTAAAFLLITRLRATAVFLPPDRPPLFAGRRHILLQNDVVVRSLPNCPVMLPPLPPPPPLLRLWLNVVVHVVFKITEILSPLFRAAS